MNLASIFSMIKLSSSKGIGTIVVFILLAGSISVGLIPKLNQPAYAHTFTSDESASFIAVIKMLQAENNLIKTNLASSPTLAQQHAKAVLSIVNGNHTFGVLPDEVSENNKRVASDITKGVNALQMAVNAKSSPTKAADVNSRIDYLNGVLQEAITVRVPKDHINNSTINAQAIKDLLNETLRQYQFAFGIPNARSAATATHPLISNMSAFQSAQAFSSESQAMISYIKSLIPTNKASSALSSSSMSNITADLMGLKNSINSKLPYQNVGNLVQKKIYPNINMSFHLK
jgi:hypothetical protein